MEKYKLVAFDMDGTLLNSQKKITQESKEAIKKALAMGKIVTLSTGRSVPELAEYVEDLANVPFFICSSGANVFNNIDKNTIYKSALDRNALLKVLELTKKYDGMGHIHCDLSVTQRDQESHLKDFLIGKYQDLFDKTSYLVDDLRQWYKENDVPVYKFDYYCTSVKQREQLYAEVKDMNFDLSDSEIASLEFSNKNTTKGAGLEHLCEYLGIPLSQTIAVGDSENDIPILKTAGLAVAMGNSKKVVLDCADVVVRDCDHGGCAQVIEEYLL